MRDVCDVLDPYNINQAVELFGNQVYLIKILYLNDDGHSGDSFDFSRSHRYGVDIDLATREDACKAVENSG